MKSTLLAKPMFQNFYAYDLYFWPKVMMKGPSLIWNKKIKIVEKVFLTFSVKRNQSEVHSLAEANVTKLLCLWFVLLSKSYDEGSKSHLKNKIKIAKKIFLAFSVKCNESEVHSLAEANATKHLCRCFVLLAQSNDEGPKSHLK